MPKTFVEVIVKYSIDGQNLPLILLWEDGREFLIDNVTDVRRAASLNVGGKGLRYTCCIQRRQIYLFLDHDKWFIDAPTL